MVAADEATPLAVVLTPGQSGDAPSCPVLLDAVPDECPVDTVVADKAFDTHAIGADLERQGIEAVIPPLACRKEPIPYDKRAYRGRNRLERLFRKLKQFRRIATR